MENGTELLFSKMNPISRKIIWSLKIDVKPIFQLHGRYKISNTVEQMIFWHYFRQKSSKISSNHNSNLKFWYFPSNFELLKEKSRKKLVLSLKFSVKISFESIDKWRIKRISQTKMWLKSSWEVLMIEKKPSSKLFKTILEVKILLISRLFHSRNGGFCATENYVKTKWIWFWWWYRVWLSWTMKIGF